MTIERIKLKVLDRFPGIGSWAPLRRWKDRKVLLGYRIKINGTICYVFLGQDGLGKQVNGQQTNIPLYCEIALAEGGKIAEKLGSTGEVVFRLLPQYKRKDSYYRFAPFGADELEAAGQKLLDVLSLILPDPVR